MNGAERRARLVPDGGPDVGGVILAAGRSERFEGDNKLLATVDGDPIVRRATESMVEADLASVVVVLGYQAEAVRRVLEDLDVEFVHNDDHEAGQSTSVERAVEVAFERQWDAAVFGLGDMPFVAPASVDAVTEAYAAGEGSIVAPAFEGKRGNPVLFDASYFDHLAAVTGDQGGRRIVEESGETVLVDTGDPGVTRDVDTEADLESFSG